MAKTALPGKKRLTAFAVDPNDLTIVGLDTEDTSKTNHELYDERIKLKLVDSEVLNIMHYGVLEPVLVRRNGPLIEVIDGRQRVRLAREANKRFAAKGEQTIDMPCLVRRDQEGDVLGVMISTNENRRDDDAINRAKKAQRMLNYGKTEQEVAIAFSCSKQAVKNLLGVLELSPKVQKAVSVKEISFSAATQLRDLTHKDQEAKLAVMVATGATGVTEAKRQRAARKNGSSANARSKRVSIAKLRQLAEDREFTDGLSGDAQYLLDWIVGDNACAEHIPGLSKAMDK